MKEIFQGILIGIGKIIPGVSGSVIAISLGVYEKAITAINTFFKDLKSNIKYLGLLGTGVLISIMFMSKLIVYLLDNHYVITIMLFIGFIIGSFKSIKTNNKYNYITIISFIFVLLIGILTGENSISFDNNITKFFFFILVGIIEAATMIIPGISGTAIMMMIGVYDLILTTYSNILQVDKLIDNLAIMLPFAIGIIIGTILIAKIIDYCYKHFFNQTNQAIKGFLSGTIVYMLIDVITKLSNISELIIGILFFIIGLISIKKINHFL